MVVLSDRTEEMNTVYSPWETKNIIVWLDGTIRPWRGHRNCDGTWFCEGQVFIYKCSCGKKAEL